MTPTPITTGGSSTTTPPPILSSIIQTIDLRGDGGSIISNQWVAQGITSTGPLGDLAVNSTLGLTNVTAPSFFGNISSYGPITGTVQSTGVRVDPIFGTTSTVSADIGRAYVTSSSTGSFRSPFDRDPDRHQRAGRPILFPMGLTGSIISRGNLISLVKANGGIYGNISAQGDIGAYATILSRSNPTQVGGIATDAVDAGQIVTMGQIIGNVTLAGGLLANLTLPDKSVHNGLIASRGSILGKLSINGQIATTAKIVSGGTIGSAALGTGLTFGVNQGIVGAIGTIIEKSADPTAAPGLYVSNAGSDPFPLNDNAQAIDAVFAGDIADLLNGFDLFANGDLDGLAEILADMARLRVVNGRLDRQIPT